MRLRHITFSAFLLLISASLYCQSYQLTVVNGYGSGAYEAGDTVHIWAGEFPATQIFAGWTGQIAFLEDRGEWHTRIIMPAQAVTVTSNTRLMPPNSDLVLENIMGRDTIKLVFSYFPPNPKAVVWFFHGTGGGAYGWVNPYDNRQLVNRCIADSLAVIITECEETTRGLIDMDNDGEIGQWQYDPTTENVDFANLAAIRDTFELRGVIADTIPNIGIGFSAGGALAVVLGWFQPEKWRVGIDYGTGGVSGAAQASISPAMICPNRRDNHPNVGPESVNEAFVHQQMYLERGICSEVYVNEPSPLHPQRFQRKPGISAAQSLALYSDLLNNNCLNSENYLTIPPHQIKNLVLANPQSWTSLATLGIQQRAFVEDELAVLWTDHHFTGDFNAKAMRFINNACGITSSTKPEPGKFSTLIRIVPNPADDMIRIEGIGAEDWIHIFSTTGQLVMTSKGDNISVAHLQSGLYIVRTALGTGKFVRI
ncbi:MAG: T9SS type A sorting domain-containing protein [Saprospiraceae bacterium]|nr:T9SS type A sorting domain-containing protein [Saprospiraceae bacterium]